MNPTVKQRLENNGWWKYLETYFESDQWITMRDQLGNLYKAGGVSPQPQNIFRVFTTTHIDDVKVVIVGTSPYQTKDTANGFAFSTNTGNPAPPTLRNIIREVECEFRCSIDPSKVTLDAWTKQGVLLLNSALTEGAGDQHHGVLWKDFTDLALKALSDHHRDKVFMLWGSYAQAKQTQIDLYRHKVLISAHPHPNTAHLFKGNNHFIAANNFLGSSIDWTAIDLIDLSNKVTLPGWTEEDEFNDRVSKCRT